MSIWKSLSGFATSAREPTNRVEEVDSLAANAGDRRPRGVDFGYGGFPTKTR